MIRFTPPVFDSDSLKRKNVVAKLREPHGARFSDRKARVYALGVQTYRPQLTRQLRLGASCCLISWRVCSKVWRSIRSEDFCEPTTRCAQVTQPSEAL